MAKDDLFDWCSDRPAWQRAAILKLATIGIIEKPELDLMQAAIKLDAGLPQGQAQSWPELTKTHLKTNTKEASRTVFGSIGPLKNIDRLAADQPPLQFGVDGVTLIYGANGSGKSGYCRIAKKVCHCLHDVRLRGNVFEPVSKDQRKITLTFRVDGEEKKRTVEWNDQEEPPPELARISVFDSEAAGLYVDKERKIEFLPFELALLTDLADVLRSLESRFNAEVMQLDQLLRTPLPSGYEGTPVSRMVAKLEIGADLPTEREMRRLGTWTSNDEAELAALVAKLKSSPALLVRIKETAKKSVENVVKNAKNAVAGISLVVVKKLTTERTSAKNARSVADASVTELFSGSAVPNLGSAAWRQMLIYARDFAAEGFPALDPPQIASADVCVLCHQPLDVDARNRLRNFDNFVAGRANDDAERAKKAFEDTARSILSLKIEEAADVASFLKDFSEENTASKALADRISGLFQACNARHAVIASVIRQRDYDRLDSLDELDDSPIVDLESALAALSEEIIALTRFVGPTDVLEDQKRLSELEAQKRFASEIETFVERRNTLDKHSKTKKCVSACSTNAVTTQITRIRRKVLTPTLKTSFESEIKAFDLEHLPLNLSDRGEVGKSKVQIDLETQQKISKNSDILSEGEKRALALAGFLAELKEMGTHHGIIIDDPVSSLDHSRLETVAKRLVEEARSGRQVIIFTHNLVFHHAITSAAIEMQVPLRNEWISKHSDGRFGIIDESQKPWIKLNVKQRLQQIEKLLLCKKASYTPSDERGRPFVREVYTKLRETWEHSIEELIFPRKNGQG